MEKPQPSPWVSRRGCPQALTLYVALKFVHSGSEVPGFVFGILIIFFVIGISLAVQPDSSLANLRPANDRASNRPGVPSQHPACVSATHAR